MKKYTLTPFMNYIHLTLVLFNKILYNNIIIIYFSVYFIRVSKYQHPIYIKSPIKRKKFHNFYFYI